MILVACSLVLAQETIAVRDSWSGCYGSARLDYEWRRAGDAFEYGERRIDAADVEAIVSMILACREEPEDVLAQVGVTREVVAAARDHIFANAVSRALADENGALPPVPPDLEYLFGYDHLAPLLRRELVDGLASTNIRSITVTFPGDPPLVVKSISQTPWMLPWHVTHGDREWRVADPAISRALLPLADPTGPNARLLDGEEYWTKTLWTEPVWFWRRAIGAELDAALSEDIYVQLAGYAELVPRLRIESAYSGSVNLQPEALFIELESYARSPIDAARWWNFLEDGVPTATWHDFLAMHERATRAVERETWLLDWKAAGPNRTLSLEVTGTGGLSESMPEIFVEPLWRDARFAGRAELELKLYRDDDWCGTVFLSSIVGGAVIATMRPAERPEPDVGAHWLDALDFSFHPRSRPAEYGRVDDEGEFELRTLERTENR